MSPRNPGGTYIEFHQFSIKNGQNNALCDLQARFALELII